MILSFGTEPEDLIETDPLNAGASRFEKRRFAIPLQRLKERVATFDLARARDKTEIYQPFVGTNTDTRQVIETTWDAPMPMSGLILDKVLGRYV